MRTQPDTDTRSPAALADLIARVEAATRGSDELDCRIVATLLSDQPVTIERSKINGAWCAYVEDFKGRPRLWDCPSPVRQNRAVTASLDAALGLAERALPGIRVRLEIDDRPRCTLWPDNGIVIGAMFASEQLAYADAPTPALALILAVLKAKQSETQP